MGERVNEVERNDGGEQERFLLVQLHLSKKRRDAHINMRRLGSVTKLLNSNFAYALLQVCIQQPEVSFQGGQLPGGGKEDPGFRHGNGRL